MFSKVLCSEVFQRVLSIDSKCVCSVQNSGYKIILMEDENQVEVRKLNSKKPKNLRTEKANTAHYRYSSGSVLQSLLTCVHLVSVVAPFCNDFTISLHT